VIGTPIHPYNFRVPKGMVLENTFGSAVAAPTEKRGFVMSKFLAVVRLHCGRSPIGAGFMGRMGHTARLAARLNPCFQHPVHPSRLKTWRVVFKSRSGACAMHTQTTITGNHAHSFDAFKDLGRFAPIDATINPVELTASDRAELQRIELHQVAYNQLGRARHALLHFSTDYAGAIANAESAIAALAALALMNGRA
jgi:hypothetical protein